MAKFLPIQAIAGRLQQSWAATALSHAVLPASDWGPPGGGEGPLLDHWAGVGGGVLRRLACGEACDHGARDPSREAGVGSAQDPVVEVATGGGQVARCCAESKRLKYGCELRRA